jgi:predicted nucleic acid-binding protein
MAGYLLDTGVVLRHLRGQRRVVSLLRALSKEGRLSIATVTRLEVHAGMKPDERYATQKFLSRLADHNLDRAIADKAGDLIAASTKSGRLLGVPDAIIAATAIAANLTLVTLNPSDFKSITGLSLYGLDQDVL